MNELATDRMRAWMNAGKKSQTVAKAKEELQQRIRAFTEKLKRQASGTNKEAMQELTRETVQVFFESGRYFQACQSQEEGTEAQEVARDFYALADNLEVVSPAYASAFKKTLQTLHLPPPTRESWVSRYLPVRTR
jgi:hypothetical protein